MYEDIWNPSNVVGDYFERRISRLFGLIRMDVNEEGLVPDFRARDQSFYVECKASSRKSSSGGVIKGEQISRFLDEIEQRRFYALAFHPIIDKMVSAYPTARRLKNALAKTSDQVEYFIFPFSVICAFYVSKKPRYKYRDRKKREPFTTLSYNEARRIFSLDTEYFASLGLDPKQYQQRELHERVHILTRQGRLEAELVKSFHPEFL